MTRSIGLGLVITLAACLLTERILNAAACGDGCTQMGWTGEVIPGSPEDWCRVMAPGQCIPNKKSNPVDRDTCIAALSGTVTYHRCTLNTCEVACENCPSAHLCQHRGITNEGCTFIATASLYECFNTM